MVCYALWIAQALLALLFLLTGGMKLVVPMDVLIEQMPVPLPAVFVRLLGAAEVAGAFGLILPGLLRIGTGLTSLAASGLVIIMIGAVMFTPTEDFTLAAIPAVVGILAAFVAYGRWRLVPLESGPSPRSGLRKEPAHA